MLLKGYPVSLHGLSESKGLVEVQAGKITYAGESGVLFPGSGHRIYDFGTGYICPGFIDLHVHGSGGADVMDGSLEALDRMSKVLAEGGTTSYLATTMSAPRHVMAEAVRSASVAAKRGTKGAKILGVHLEGPFLNPAQKGSQKEEFLRLPNIEELKEYIDLSGGLASMITLAPELPGAMELIEYAAGRGLVVSLGHSVASIAHVNEACRAGLSHVSHAFNAMGGLHHREPGATGAILSMEQLTADIIADGLHVHPSVINILIKVKGIYNICVITDCMRAGAMGDGIFELGGQRVIVKNGEARLEDGTISGSTSSMAGMIKTLVEKVRLSVPDAVRMVSANPARLLGIDSKGVLREGKDADIVVMDRRFNILMTIVEGKIVYEKPPRQQ